MLLWKLLALDLNVLRECVVAHYQPKVQYDKIPRAKEYDVSQNKSECGNQLLRELLLINPLLQEVNKVGPIAVQR